MLNIKVVGSGCPTCQKLETLCREVVSENGLDAQIEKISDINQFADYGIFITPGLLINNRVVSSGKLPDKPTLTRWIMEAKS